MVSNPKIRPIGPHAAAAANDAEDSAPERRNAAENIPGANPVVGPTREQLLDAAARLFKLLSLNPVTVARKEARLALELGRILLGRSKIVPDPGDRRFQHSVWRENGYYRRLMQTHLAWARCLHGILDSIDAGEEDRERARFILTQVIAAAAPTNYPLGNPGFLDKTLSSRGLSVVRGLRNFIDDMTANHGMPRQVNPRAFRVGENLANSPGAVVFRNPVCEIIQYAPRTEAVDAVPVLVIPPQINKYYILDLAGEKSFVRYAAGRGQQVFAISWRNPTAAQRDWGLESYVTAAKEAVDVVREITGTDSVKLMAVCAGGFTAAVLAGHLYALGQGRKIASLTLSAAVLDTGSRALPGLFANDAAIEAAIARGRARGVLDGAEMQRAFAWLRPDDLVWNFFANNYLMGNDPPASDILYWNSDTTRLPAQFHADVLNIFRRNPLVEPGGMTVLGTPIDLGEVNCDVFIIAGIADHVIPWRACYRSTGLFGGDARFVLGASGHIQTIVNPPGNPEARYFEHDDFGLDADEWLENAEGHDGSWWEAWVDWARAHSAGERDAPTALGSETHPPGEPAPGRYIHQR